MEMKKISLYHFLTSPLKSFFTQHPFLQPIFFCIISTPFLSVIWGLIKVIFYHLFYCLHHLVS